MYCTYPARQGQKEFPLARFPFSAVLILLPLDEIENCREIFSECRKAFELATFDINYRGVFDFKFRNFFLSSTIYQGIHYRQDRQENFSSFLRISFSVFTDVKYRRHSICKHSRLQHLSVESNALGLLSIRTKLVPAIGDLVGGHRRHDVKTEIPWRSCK